MPRLTKIYTRTGDEGTTGLGIRRRVSKDDARVAGYGDVDELSSQIGVALASDPTAELGEALLEIQNDLFHLGSDLCIPEEDKATLEVPTIEARHVEQLEAWIDLWLEELPSLENFILPGGTQAAAALHLARTVCRRAERSVVTLARAEVIGPFALSYLNRLSDLLFVAARLENKRKGKGETTWDSRA